MAGAERLLDPGYFPKVVVWCPEYPHTPPISHVLSVSHHVSLAPHGWIDCWRHNELGSSTGVADAKDLMSREAPGRDRLFGDRILPQVFVRGDGRAWVAPPDVRPERGLAQFISHGFDVVSRWSANTLGFDCSPLSCNGLAAELETAAGCLFATVEAAIGGARQFAREQPEPGDYYVLEVLEAPFGLRR
jgi:hypothetical protein